MQSFGGLMAARELWEKALEPSLLSGAGTWLGECKEAVELCDQIQNLDTTSIEDLVTLLSSKEC